MFDVGQFKNSGVFVFSNGESYPATLENGSKIASNLQRSLSDRKLAAEKARKELKVAERRLNFAQEWIHFYQMNPTRMAEYSSDYRVFAVNLVCRKWALVCAKSEHDVHDLWVWLRRSHFRNLSSDMLIDCIELVPPDMPLDIWEYRAVGQFTVQQAAWFAYDVDAKYGGEPVMIWSSLSDGQGSPWQGIAKSTFNTIYGVK